MRRPGLGTKHMAHFHLARKPDVLSVAKDKQTEHSEGMRESQDPILGRLPLPDAKQL